MLFAFAYMASLQHGICIGTGLLSVEGLYGQGICPICDLGAGNTLDSLDPHTFDLFNIQLAFAAHTDNIGFFPVHPVLLDELVKAVGITRFQAYQGLSLQFGGFNHIFA